MLFGHLYVFFGELSKSSAHFLIVLFAFLMLNCISYLYILEINPFLIYSYANILSHFWGLCFCVLCDFLCWTRALKFNWIPFVYFLKIIHIILEGRLKKILLQFLSKNVLLTFSSKTFRVSRLTFRSLIHFEFFVCVYDVKRVL